MNEHGMTDDDWYGTYYVEYEIRRDLNKEKEELTNYLYDASTSMWGQTGSLENREDLLKVMARIEDITVILNDIQNGVYKNSL